MKQEINKLLQDTLINYPEAMAAWLGGSTATKTEDELSDTDLVVVASDAEKIFAAVEVSLNKNFPISQTWTVEEPQKYRQKFYILENTAPLYFVDLAVFVNPKPEELSEYFNVPRHGAAEVLFDKTDILKTASELFRPEVVPNLNRVNFLARLEIMYRIFQKEVLRGRYIDSFTFYQRLIHLLLMVERRKHSPQRFDFGMRYLYRDLPKESADFFESCLKVSSLDDMKINADRIKKRIEDFQ
ncbi:hypothetical protein [Pseudobdellovibrio exovorus]|uniref:Polymerase nucleotidyl transferase domain-containing protein n=1 Tax=Pseudobdellovibrio exovorus JSS TaxID=1184267 RepID=M4V5B3_9BACT|nr:hypothetical protein [Pseudobdellovibrio exovorus]AGH94512.1 hypothetical protein A11Q_292 [Pseudobdellovibrio exovorus JSS]